MVVNSHYSFLYQAVKDKAPWWRTGQCVIVNPGQSYVRIAGRVTNYKHARMREVVAVVDPSTGPHALPTHVAPVVDPSTAPHVAPATHADPTVTPPTASTTALVASTQLALTAVSYTPLTLPTILRYVISVFSSSIQK